MFFTECEQKRVINLGNEVAILNNKLSEAKMKEKGLEKDFYELNNASCRTISHVYKRDSSIKLIKDKLKKKDSSKPPQVCMEMYPNIRTYASFAYLLVFHHLENRN